MITENGQIKLLRESINLFELGLAVYQNGLADLKVPDTTKSYRPLMHMREPACHPRRFADLLERWR